VNFPWIPEDKAAVVMEIGCGVGNTIFPLMELNHDKYFIGFDCSAHAVANFKVCGTPIRIKR
jgi:tRNA G46 methylase TrmB